MSFTPIFIQHWNHNTGNSSFDYITIDEPRWEIHNFRQGDFLAFINDVTEADYKWLFIGNERFDGDRPAELRFIHHKLKGDTDGDGHADFIVKVDHGFIHADDLMFF